MAGASWSNQKYKARKIATCALLVGLLVGCGEKDWGYVSGTVTLEGNPVGPGSLMFEPIDPENSTARAGIAHFREDGKYEIKSAGNRAGTRAGEYRVMIHGRGEEAFGDETIEPGHKSNIPTRYMDFASGLTATVKTGENTIDFVLEP